MNNDATEGFTSSCYEDEAKIKVIIDKSRVCLKSTYLNDNLLGTASVALFILLSLLQLRNKSNCISVIICSVGLLVYALFQKVAGLRTFVFGSEDLAMEKLT